MKITSNAAPIRGDTIQTCLDLFRLYTFVSRLAFWTLRLVMPSRLDSRQPQQSTLISRPGLYGGMDADTQHCKYYIIKNKAHYKSLTTESALSGRSRRGRPRIFGGTSKNRRHTDHGSAASAGPPPRRPFG